MANMDPKSEVWECGIPKDAFEEVWAKLRELHPDTVEVNNEYYGGLKKRFLKFEGEWGKGMLFEIFTPADRCADGHARIDRWITKKAWEELGRPHMRSTYVKIATG